MTFAEFMKSRKKRAILLFLAGFFFGGIIYYMSLSAAGDVFTLVEENLVLWAATEVGFSDTFWYVLWHRGKVMALLWVMAQTKWARGYIRVFIVYVGMQAGFLLLFFLYSQGVQGSLLWVGSGLPHMLLLIPAYIYSFYRIFERKRETSPAAIFLIVILFLLSLVLEAKGNVMLMQWLLTEAK